MPVGNGALELCVQALDLRIGVALKVDQAFQLADLAVLKADRFQEQLPFAHDREPPAPYGFARQVDPDLLRLAAVHHARITAGGMKQKLIDRHNSSVLMDINAVGTMLQHTLRCCSPAGVNSRRLLLWASRRRRRLWARRPGWRTEVSAFNRPCACAGNAIMSACLPGT